MATTNQNNPGGQSIPSILPPVTDPSTLPLPPYLNQNPGEGGQVPILPPVTGDVTHATQNPGTTTPPTNGGPPEAVQTFTLPSILAPVDDCMRSVSVFANPGSTVAVYVNGKWRGTAEASVPIAVGPGSGIGIAEPAPITGIGPIKINIPPSTLVEVPLTGCCLKIGDLVQTAQIDPATGQEGTLSTGVRVEDHHKYSYLTQQYNMQRTGWYPYETNLNPGSDWANFKVRRELKIDGKAYAQPLYLHHQYFPFLQSAHNVVFIATENDSVYAFDADNGEKLWQRSLLPDGHRPVRMHGNPNGVDIDCEDITPVCGISSTPVIDCECKSECQCGSDCDSGCGCQPTCKTATMYVTSKSVLDSDSSIHWYLHALDVITGLERENSPTEISGTMKGSGGATVVQLESSPTPDPTLATNDGSGNILFNAKIQNNRPGLLLVGETIYIAFASHCDFGPYFGWIISYDASKLQQKNIFCTTPDGEYKYQNTPLGGIWQGSTGLASDGQSIYCTTGNGTFDANTGGRDYGDSVLKLSPDLQIQSYFTPSDQSILNSNDVDFGSGGVLILPDPQFGQHANVLVTCGKSGDVWVLDRNRLGGFSGIVHPPLPNTTPPTLTDNPGAVFVTELQPSATANRYGNPNSILNHDPDNAPGPWGGPAYFQGDSGAQYIVYCGNGNLDNPGKLTAFQLENGTLVRRGTSAGSFPNLGSTPVISSNGRSLSSAIIWAVLRDLSLDGTLHLRAYSGSALAHGGVVKELKDLSIGPWAPAGRAFIEPLVINGKVYVAYSHGDGKNVIGVCY